MKFRLYCGYVHTDGKWYNYASLKKMEGGKLAVLDGPNKSNASRMYNIIHGCIDKFYDEENKELENSEIDFYKVKLIDAQQIAHEYMKFLNDGEHVFTEHLYCERCSSVGNERYTEVKENFDDLIKEGSIIELFAEKKENLRYETKLPIPLEIAADARNFEGGIFDTVIREPMNIGDGIDLANDPKTRESEKNIVMNKWDKEIVGIKGMDASTFKAFVKRKGQSFSAKYLNDEENQDALFDEKVFGMDVSNRVVRCSNCRHDIGGRVDFTNFFLQLFQSKSKHRSGMIDTI